MLAASFRRSLGREHRFRIEPQADHDLARILRPRRRRKILLAQRQHEIRHGRHLRAREQRFRESAADAVAADHGQVAVPGVDRLRHLLLVMAERRLAEEDGLRQADDAVVGQRLDEGAPRRLRPDAAVAEIAAAVQEHQIVLAGVADDLVAAGEDDVLVELDDRQAGIVLADPALDRHDLRVIADIFQPGRRQQAVDHAPRRLGMPVDLAELRGRLAAILFAERERLVGIPGRRAAQRADRLHDGLRQIALQRGLGRSERAVADRHHGTCRSVG